METIATKRNSNLELFRIITMLLIVAHHYVVNSGLLDVGGVVLSNYLSFKSVIMLLLGAWGKTGINCFVMITGYFMCKSQVSIKKYFRLLFEVYFYSIVIGSIFLITRYETFSVSRLFEMLWPFSDLSKNFTSCFLVFYLILPFLKELVSHLNEKNHLRLTILLLFFFSVLSLIPLYELQFNYVTWFVIIFFVASYIRLYDKAVFHNNKLWTTLMVVSILLSSISVIFSAWVGTKIGAYPHYFFVIDSNKPLPLLVSLSSFMFFNNLDIKQSKVINSISASTFGVLLIHANCDSMRKWLWKDVLDNIGYFNTDYFLAHAVVSVIAVFFICVLIDKMRIVIFEKPIMKLIDLKWNKSIEILKRRESKILSKMSISD